MPAVLEQKITGEEARRILWALVRAHGEAAPGPFGLRLQPTPERLAALPTTPTIRSASNAAGRRRSGGSADSPPGWRRPRPSRSRPPIAAWGPSSGSGRGPSARSPEMPWATPTPSASATSTCRTWSRSPSPASRAAMTPGCSSCSSRSGASEAGSSVCSKRVGSRPRSTAREWRRARSPGSDAGAQDEPAPPPSRRRPAPAGVSEERPGRPPGGFGREPPDRRSGASSRALG